MEDTDPKAASPIMAMFEGFRSELDEHHDRRERIVKSSRDITAASKKIIFALQRVRKLNAPIPQNVKKTYTPHADVIASQFGSISKDVQGLHAYLYQSQISPGIQEWMESVAFEHYLLTQKLISYEGAREKLEALGNAQGGGPVLLTHEDYLLGLFDFVGEVMRFAVTNMATLYSFRKETGAPTQKPELPPQRRAAGSAMEVDTDTSATREQSVVEDMQELRMRLEQLDMPHYTPFGKNVDKKMEVMQQCVDKVEKAAYGLVVRGSERPKGWMPDLSANTEAVEAY
ncbi:translin-associated factor TraX [Aulographum hederae CBS 113979]|uniref:Translin-associated factor TraX n=1 Tax=Aulographum hederae CBS 113979 TaxID=1176131 RepID=A0A6G1HB71_9PEZI|nr:translin-associated factor TraX [Aulographum hederae CBS 113979]